MDSSNTTDSEDGDRHFIEKIKAAVGTTESPSTVKATLYKKKGTTYVVSNQTAYRIGIYNKGEKEKFALVIAAFGEIKYTVNRYDPVTVTVRSAAEAGKEHPSLLTEAEKEEAEKAEKELDLDDWKNWNLVKVKPEKEHDDSSFLEMSLGLIFVIFFYGAVVWGVWKIFGEPNEHYWRNILFLSLAISLIFPCARFFQKKEKKKGFIKKVIRSGRKIVQLASMSATILVAFGLPAFFIVLRGEIRNDDYQTSSQRAAALTQLQMVKDLTQSDAAKPPSDEEPHGNWLTVAKEKCCLGIIKLYSVFKDKLWRSRFYFKIDDHLLGRILQFLFIGVFSSLPAFLFYLFNRQRLSAIRENFFRSMLIVDPSLMNLSDAKSIYGQRVDEVCGRVPEESDNPKASDQLLKAKRTIILIATVIITIGWILCLSPVGDAASVGTHLYDYFDPSPSPTVFAFLGAYVFSVGLLFRLYIRSDLKPKAYAHVSVRIITSIALVWALSMLPVFSKADSANNDFLLPAAFIIGFFPWTGFNLLFEAFKNLKLLKHNFPSIEERFPLKLLDGINNYHIARLTQEGIENLENMVHADLVDLMLQTRIPLSTLVDWFDQGILYLHLGRTFLESEKKEANESGEDADRHATVEHSISDLQTDIEILRAYGVRSATDLKEAYVQARNSARIKSLRGNHYLTQTDLAEITELESVYTERRNGDDTVHDQKPFKEAYVEAKMAEDEMPFLNILEYKEAGNKPKRLQTILDAISDDEWMPHLEHYRNIERFRPQTYEFDDFEKKFAKRSNKKPACI